MPLFVGTTASETITGSQFPDDIFGGGGRDLLYGGAGNDRIHGGSDADLLDGGAGDDYLFADDGADQLFGGDGNDELLPGNGADTVDGGSGNDLIVSELDSASDIFSGGAGSDRFQLNARGPSSTLQFIDRIRDFSAAEGDRLDIGIRNDQFASFNGAVATAGFTLTAGQSLGAGAGGVADIWTYFRDGLTYLILDTDDNNTLGANDLVVALEGSVVLGASSFYSGTFIQSGTSGPDVWVGGAGDDNFFGLGGNDTASGEGGADQIDGGTGDDRLNGGDGDDLLIGDLGNDILYGGSGADRLYAAFQFNTVAQDTGSINELYGEGGDDALIGGAGRDRLDGGDGDDVLDSRGDDTANGGDTLVGGAGADYFRLNGDVADGGDGNDVFYLGAAASRIAGGSGADRFDLTSTSSGGNFTRGVYDLISDFDEGQGDLLNFGGMNFYTPRLVFRGALDNAAFSLAAGTRFSSNDFGSGFAQVWTWVSGDLTYLIADLDGSGDLGSADYVLTLRRSAPLTEAAFSTGAFLQITGGTANPDTYQGGAGNDVYYGFGGDDVIFGNGGQDELYGNLGNDRLDGGAGQDQLNGGEGNDALEGGDDADQLTGAAGDDILNGGGGDDYLKAGGDWVGESDAPTARNVLHGGEGNDQVVGGGGLSDQLYGDAGNDSIAGSGLLDGGDGNDSLRSFGASTLLGGAGDDVLRGGLFDDYLVGGSGSDSALGGDGNDVMVIEFGDAGSLGDSGNDLFVVSGLGQDGQQALYLDGGIGVDTVDFSATSRSIQLDLTAGPGVESGIGRVTLVGIENVIGGHFGSTLTGSAAANRLTGGRGADTLSGRGGDDVLVSGGGRDTLDGGDGFDVADYDGLDRGVEAHLDRGTVSWISDSLDIKDTVISIEGLAGTGFADVLAGDDYANSLSGRGGNDYLAGQGGDDRLTGGADNDTIDGGVGLDTAVFSGAANSYAFADGVLVVTGVDGVDRLANVEVMQLGNQTLRLVAGSAGADALTNTAAAELIVGGQGADALMTGVARSAATLTYDAAGVSLTIGGVTDRLAGIETLIFTDGTYDFGANGRLAPSARQTLTGTAAADTLTGSDSNDSLLGGAGNDTLSGLGGSDLLDGGDGVDVALYAGARRQYTASVTTVAGGPEGGTDTLLAVEGARFVDGTLTFDVNSQAAEVMRLYDAALDRQPDPSGFEAQLDNLERGVSLATLAEAFVNSAEFQARYGTLSNQQFVEQLYRFCLDREGEPQGIQGWINHLNSGLSRRDALVLFSESVEHRTLTAPTLNQGLWVADDQAIVISRMYDATFDRLADASGLAAWTANLKGGMALIDIAAAFATSPEFQQRYGSLTNEQFIDQMYRFCLDRAPDGGGMTFWVNALNTGTSRAQMLLNFSESAEHVALTRSLWLGGIQILGATVAPEGDGAKSDLHEAQVLPGMIDDKAEAHDEPQLNGGNGQGGIELAELNVDGFVMLPIDFGFGGRATLRLSGDGRMVTDPIAVDPGDQDAFVLPAVEDLAPLVLSEIDDEAFLTVAGVRFDPVLRQSDHALALALDPTGHSGLDDLPPWLDHNPGNWLY